ncbi:hypothetical protein HOLleu_21200 [Holothuria leucospilota]|uniref:Uncharacterized protein n=1 Tax=Holothuria leucospilota TaxID=206669 RepID=A0A9Q1BXC0_HOLLE|nr:hypothetical protein HOLleu_21200 [Holothuria leucospilota]
MRSLARLHVPALASSPPSRHVRLLGQLEVSQANGEIPRIPYRYFSRVQLRKRG